MTWVIEGFDKVTHFLVERIDVSDSMSESEIISALGGPENVRFAAWPVTPELIKVVEAKTGLRPNLASCDYFAEYQIDLPSSEG